MYQKLMNIDEEINNLQNSIEIYKNKKRNDVNSLENLKNEISKKEESVFTLKMKKAKLLFHSSNLLLIEDTKNKYNITDEEIDVIYEGMDKYDYKSELESDNIPRYIDFIRIAHVVSSIKNKYTTWKLLKVTNTSSQDSFPPTNGYSYKFQDDSNNIFSY